MIDRESDVARVSTVPTAMDMPDEEVTWLRLEALPGTQVPEARGRVVTVEYPILFSPSATSSSRSAGTAGRRAEILRVDATEPEEGVVEPASFIRTATSLDVLPVDVRVGTVGRHLSLLVRLHAAEAAKECAQVQATLAAGRAAAAHVAALSTRTLTRVASAAAAALTGAALGAAATFTRPALSAAPACS